MNSQKEYNYEENLEYQMENGKQMKQLKQNDTSDLIHLGFTENSTLFIKLQLKQIKLPQKQLQYKTINVNLVYSNLQQKKIYLKISIDPEIQLKIFTNEIKEQICTPSMKAEYNLGQLYQLGNRTKIKQSETISLQQLGFTQNYTQL